MYSVRKGIFWESTYGQNLHIRKCTFRENVLFKPNPNQNLSKQNKRAQGQEYRMRCVQLLTDNCPNPGCNDIFLKEVYSSTQDELTHHPDQELISES